MRTFLSADRLVIVFFIVGSFVGIWHALPMLNVIRDEQYFVGGVLRAIEMKSVLPPAGAVPYGTLTFYLNYVLQIPFLLGLFVWKGLSVTSLKTYLVLHPETAYLVPRFLSAVIATAVAIAYDRFLRSEHVPLIQRFAALSVIFCTLIATVTLHTGKMWVLSAALMAVSAFCTYAALKRYVERRTESGYGPTFWSTVCAFSALANFSFAGIFLINVPVLLFVSRNDAERFRTTIWGILVGVLILLTTIVTNWSNMYATVTDTFSMHPVLGGGASGIITSFLTSFMLHFEQLLVAFPLVIAVLVAAPLMRAVQNKLLFRISLAYAGLYFLAIVCVGWWNEVGRQLHYLFPLIFFFSGAIASVSYERMRYVLWVFCGLQTLVFLYALYLLSVPTTYNQAGVYIQQNLKQEHVLILNDVVELSLPFNKETALLQNDKDCGVKCLYWRSRAEVSDFIPAVVTSQSQIGKVNIASYGRAFLITDQQSMAPCVSRPVATFQSGSSDAKYVDVEYNFGHYFLPDFWHLSRLGKNLKLYEVSGQCAENLLSDFEQTSEAH